MAKKEGQAEEVVLDFTNVKERNFNTKHLPPGDYPARVVKIEVAESKSGNPQWIVTLELTGGGAGAKKASYPYYCGLTDNQLWKIRNLYAACGLTIPKKKVRLNPQKQILGKALGVTLDEEEYEGKMQSKPVDVLPLSEIQDNDLGDAGEDDVEEEPEAEAPKKEKKSKKDKKDKPKPKASDVDEDELEELEIDEL